MKNLHAWLLILVLGLTLCSSNTQTDTLLPPVLVTVEVTRIVQITPTLKPADASSTQTAELIGTPIVANMECYLTAIMQSELNNCAITRSNEMEKQIKTLVDAITGKHFYSEKELQTFLQFQSEWGNFIKRECEFQSGYLLEGDSGLLKGGTMAPMNYYECLTQKYQDRLRELQIILYNMSI